MDKGKSHSTFKIGNTAQERSLSYVPNCYKVPSSDRPSSCPDVANVPVIDLAMLKVVDAAARAKIVDEIRNACLEVGFFQVVNHGIDQEILDGAIATSFEFFGLPAKEKVKFMSSDVTEPMRYGSSVRDGVDKVQFWRVFLKHYAHPLKDWIDLWPENPRSYRENMGKYCVEVRKLALELMETITEGLGIGPKYLGNKMEEGMQVMAVNCYPPCPQPQTTLGLPPHSDYSCLTILLQSSKGLEIIENKDCNGNWKLVPEVHGALQVHVGDHLEVLSNGMYKSVLHRATLNSEKTRISIASLHSLGMDEKMRPAKELVNDQNPERYKASSFGDFLKFLSKNSIGETSFISTLKIDDQHGSA